jgi:hypothetical protein
LPGSPPKHKQQEEKMFTLKTITTTYNEDGSEKTREVFLAECLYPVYVHTHAGDMFEAKLDKDYSRGEFTAIDANDMNDIEFDLTGNMELYVTDSNGNTVIKA